MKINGEYYYQVPKEVSGQCTGCAFDYKSGEKQTEGCEK